MYVGMQQPDTVRAVVEVDKESTPPIAKFNDFLLFERKTANKCRCHTEEEESQT